MATRYSLPLDSLRGIAVSAVLFHHYLPESWRPVSLGGLGVRLFFVLSGYLITLNLLDCREYIEGDQPFWLTIRRFYARRTLRIFPIYYLLLIATAVFDVAGARALAPWTFGYATNIYIALTGIWPGPFSPFWSLAVEEQFYLIWPWLILLMPRKGLWAGCLAAVAVAPVCRVIGMLAGLSVDRAGVLPWSCLDTLGIGAATAIATHHLTSRPRALQTIRRLGPWAAVIALVVLTERFPPLFSAAALDLTFGVACAALVSVCAQGVVPRWTLLDSVSLSSLGRVSYGVYVLHAFASVLIGPFLARSGAVRSVVVPAVVLVTAVAARHRIPATLRGLLPIAGASYLVVLGGLGAAKLARLEPAHRDVLVYFGLCWFVTVCAAGVSWVAFEGPVNAYKRYFPYRAARPLS